MRQKRETALNRRNFLRAIGTVPAAAAAATVLPSAAEAYDPGQAETKARYQPDSPDVKAFYRTNGYETLKK